MKNRLFALTLAVVLLMTLLTGCAVARKLDAAEEKLEHKIDSVEDSIENKVDAAEDRMEKEFEQTGTVTVTPAPDTKVYNSPTPDQITEAEAIDIALKHSGFTEDQVQYLHTEYEIDDRVPQYDVQFYVDRWEYEYEIHAETGAIISFDKDD